MNYAYELCYKLKIINFLLIIVWFFLHLTSIKL